MKLNPNDLHNLNPPNNSNTMIIPITKGANNPILRRKDNPKYGKVTKKTAKLLKDMEESMIAAKGVGIAATQIGLNTRVCHITLGRLRRTFPMINPEILEWSEETKVEQEGCLSLPGHWGPVERSVWVKAKFVDAKGQEKIMRFEDFDARIVQHEVDHLNGTLFIDHVPEGKLEVE